MFDNIDNIFNNIADGKNYYFFRTSKGLNFDPFRNGNFIGINWNYITTQDLINLSEFQIKQKIANNEQVDIATTEGKKTSTGIYNKIKRFQNLKTGDVVVIPSNRSETLGFGYITDANIYIDHNDPNCNWIKRRKVNWVTFENLNDLDSIFYKIVYSKHTISTLNNYASYIDKIISSAFVKDERSHLVFNLRNQDDIDDDALINLVANVKRLSNQLSANLNLGDLNESSMKINAQSPGILELIYKQSKSLLLVGLILSSQIVVNCSHTIGENAQNGTNLEIQNERDTNLSIIRDTINQTNLSNQEKIRLAQESVAQYDTIANTKKDMEKLDARIERLNKIE